jgi:hypothetical protein
MRGVSGRKAIAEAKKSRCVQVQGEIPLSQKDRETFFIANVYRTRL